MKDVQNPSTLTNIFVLIMRTHNEKRYTCVHESCLPTAERPIVFYPTFHALQHHTRTAHPPTCTHASCNGRVFASGKNLREHQKLHAQRDEEAQLNAMVAGSDGEDEEMGNRRKNVVGVESMEETGNVRLKDVQRTLNLWVSIFSIK
ncbi:hypothetical protein BT96DRAFT_667614 [Gymnopus androsaceus JB14]|uniref:C2H2-type domain-containing protein n=1 Tax=Gymnopus androsaceus JB14 TaxID=1447944 RepID=A0A6A4IFA0_9AGAR|nr:hypothetical protein BT96DRAFT_667614 [Gymnopus androsaceus JB14]